MIQENKQEIFEKIFKEHLKIETYSKSIDSLLGPRLRNRINYAPYYQRNYVWDINKATYFIESILLGTEIPPLIFFDNNSEIEIIDGRQRFETILRFVQNKFQLSEKGLYVLKSLKKKSYDNLAKENKKIIDNFLDFKLRIIEFKLVNEPPLDKLLEDRVKKEIFSRYNSGITPLKKAEIDNAIYNDDNLSNQFKSFLEENLEFQALVYETFIKSTEKNSEKAHIETLMSFIRRSLILPQFPINYYSQSKTRIDFSNKLYEYFADKNVDNEEQVIEYFVAKAKYINYIKEIAIKKGRDFNKLAAECFLWVLGILELEEKNVQFNEELAEKVSLFIHKNIKSYTEVDYGFSQEIFERFSKTAEFISANYQVNSSLYVKPNEITRQKIKGLTKPIDTLTKQDELKTLRVNKPEPSRNSVEDLCRIMNRRRFLVRPTYQRKEVINPLKASAIIESILLGITIPAIFVYKRLEDDQGDALNEVIDGQQRILTLLGFIGNEYINENNKSEYSKNHKFSLRGLKILKQLNGSTFEKLDESLKSKILDFQLYIVEIDENQNPNFDPIDLFIRLNDKPYPIKEHSFEMWNSWVNYNIIEEIKIFTQKVKPWFYLRQIKNENDRDRMENEELMTILTFLEYSKRINDPRKTFDLFQKKERINARVNSKSYVSALLLQISENHENTKEQWFDSFKGIKSFINKLKIILLDKNVSESELSKYLGVELDNIFKANKKSRYFRRTIQDFYLMWHLISDINLEMVKLHRLGIKEDLKGLFTYMKNLPEDQWNNGDGVRTYINKVEDLKNKYSISERRLRLTTEEVKEMIRNQGGVSTISQAPIFEGDEIEIDHIIPIAKGGQDSIENLGIVHKDENRTKGTKLN
jgi:hypothetical protein